MKIRLNEDMDALCTAFHNGDISLAEYRLQRRKILDNLSNDLEGASNHSSPLIRRVVGGVVIIVSLLIGTIILIKTVL